MAKFLVTGGAGYVGSHFCKSAAHAGHELLVVDNLSTGFEQLVRWSELICLDVRDTAALHGILKRFMPDAIVHFAASAYVGDSVRDPLAYYANNLTGIQSLISACCSAGVLRIIFSSTCATYGIPEVCPITESAPLRPVSPYGETKLASERLLHWCGAAYGLRWVALRYFNAAGADVACEIGELHDPETHVIPLALGASSGRLGPLQIFGDDYPTNDGTAVRDYVHVSDLANAHLRAFDYLLGGGLSRAFNLGIGKGYSVLEVLAAIQRVSGRCVPASTAPRRPGDPPALYASATEARQELGWVPVFSELDEIVDSAWRWEQRISA